jgi:hypothetical protein
MASESEKELNEQTIERLSAKVASDLAVRLVDAVLGGELLVTRSQTHAQRLREVLVAPTTMQ